MNKMLVEIKDIIIARLKTSPINIMSAAMYGSWARGTDTEDSDIDILLVSDELAFKKHRRGKEVAQMKDCLSLAAPTDILFLTSDECSSNFRNHNPLFLDIAVEGIILIDDNKFLQGLLEETRMYIGSRRLEKLVDGWRFPVLYREPTCLSSVSNKDFATVMLTDAERDFNIGVNITEDGYFDKAVYHFQQSAEKAVKAVLIAFGEFKKTHFVGGILLERLKTVELEGVWKDKLYSAAEISNQLEPEVTWSRYPGIDSGRLWVPYEEYTIEDAVEIRSKAETVLKIAKDFIQWWFKV